MEVNIWAVIVATIVAFIIGAVWYGFLFQKQWMQITGAVNRSEEEMAKMRKEAGPLYLIQFLITLVQAYVLAHFIGAAGADISAVEVGLWIFVGFVFPTLIGAVMWTNTPRNLMRMQIAIQLGCQIVTLVVMSLIIGMWQ